MPFNARVIAVQMCSGMEPEQNFRQLEQWLEQSHLNEPTLVCLPECWLAFMQDAKQSLQLAEHYQYWLERLGELCRRYRIWLSAGTIATKGSEDGYYAASFLLNEAGEAVGRYNKIHLFDADVADGSGGYRESHFTIAGNEVVVVDSPFGKIGLSVCYDLRFAGLYQTMRDLGAEILLVPSAFTTVTGAAHWLPLLQARAIENQCFVVAPAQYGTHENGRKTYGHSLILSPWGDVLADAKQQLGVISAELDLTQLHKLRTDMPVQVHNRFKSEFYE
ncbi:MULTISPECIES: carbon-nitrogen hydrolase family protein [Pseudoalteromonas]|uniref:Amidohydrolase n=1 Tax=Pseudoalteromonas amylolytica TaxID=1859457 RepID=A0A1S1N1W9_9GAMM|nr:MULTISPECIES: carbon-nitrogen hydrolase family protein [Pseudoalteromonas]OHU90786.1 amidohydrolase [Pseudoalteromonas sp. JW3]OHU92594.1 amidohydrolase [Pseudoalteromonas amylolytica]